METHLPAADQNPVTPDPELSRAIILSPSSLSSLLSLAYLLVIAFLSDVRHSVLCVCVQLLQNGKKGAGTLWDQEKDELAVRILLEEGKLNLAIRILRKYKQEERSPHFAELVAETCKKFNSDQASVHDRCRVFEQSLGTLLKYAFSHIEALQIMDVGEFMEHCGEVLYDARKDTRKEVSPEDDRLQDTLVVYYLAAVALQLEEMSDEERVMHLMEKHAIVPTLVEHLLLHYKWYSLEILQAAALFLTSVMSSDAFTTEESRYIKGEEAMSDLVELKGLFIDQLHTDYGLKKKDVSAPQHIACHTSTESILTGH
jgi:hypothetical protein